MSAVVFHGCIVPILEMIKLAGTVFIGEMGIVGKMFSHEGVPEPRHFSRNAASMAARKIYPDRCISVSDSSGSTSIDAMQG